MKPREFFIGLDENGFARWLSMHNNFSFINTDGHEVKENIKAREVMPINWDYIWATMNQEFLYQVMNLDFVKRYQDRLQELIENQLAGVE